MRIEQQLSAPSLAIIEDCHRPVADNDELSAP
jgi:hypothetical protein